MNIDESLLSGYLDEEIDPAERRIVEESIGADPALNDRLRRLTVNRDAVAGLTRPSAPCGLASSLMSRIQESRNAQRRRPYLWVATAASIAFALILTLRSKQFVPETHIVRADDSVLQIVRNPLPAAVEDAPVVSVVPLVRNGVVAVATLPAVEQEEIADRLREESRRQLLTMLDRPGARRIIVFTDATDAGARDRVNRLLSETARKRADFGRFTLPQGLVIDPGHPNEAEVFATLMDDPERRQVLQNLVGEFTMVIDEPASAFDARQYTQLAEVGRVRIESGKSAAGLSESPPNQEMHAIRHQLEKYEFPVDPANLILVPDLQPRLSPTGRPASGPVPVLIWMTSHQAMKSPG